VFSRAHSEELESVYPRYVCIRQLLRDPQAGAPELSRYGLDRI
jgi:hypothetical protein